VAKNVFKVRIHFLLANLFMRMPRDMNRGEHSGSHTVYRYVIVHELQRP